MEIQACCYQNKLTGLQAINDCSSSAGRSKHSFMAATELEMRLAVSSFETLQKIQK